MENWISRERRSGKADGSPLFDLNNRRNSAKAAAGRQLAFALLTKLKRGDNARPRNGRIMGPGVSPQFENEKRMRGVLVRES